MSETIYSRTERVLAGASVMALGLGSGIVAYFTPGKASFFPGCPLLNITGFACPGCGLTRGFHELFRGHFLAALDFNALVPIYAFIFLFLAVLYTSIAIRGKGLRFTIISPTTIGIFLGVSTVFGVLRNIPIEPFKILFP